MGMMTVLDRTGDHKSTWDPDNEVEVQAARETFENLRKQGYMAYTVDEQGDKREVLNRFDPAIKSMILSPALVGG